MKYKIYLVENKSTVKYGEIMMATDSWQSLRIHLKWILHISLVSV